MKNIFILLFTLILLLSCGDVTNNENKNNYKSDTITNPQNVNSKNFDKLYRKLEKLNESIDEIEDSTDLLIFLESKKILYREIDSSSFKENEMEIIKLLSIYDTLAIKKMKWKYALKSKL